MRLRQVAFPRSASGRCHSRGRTSGGHPGRALREHQAGRPSWRPSIGSSGGRCPPGPRWPQKGCEGGQEHSPSDLGSLPSHDCCLLSELGRFVAYPSIASVYFGGSPSSGPRSWSIPELSPRSIAKHIAYRVWSCASRPRRRRSAVAQGSASQAASELSASRGSNRFHVTRLHCQVLGV